MTDRNVDLGKPAENQVAFFYQRSAAIEMYANLEQSLSDLLAHLLGVDKEAAASIFYQVVNTRSRNRIIEDMLPKRRGSSYDNYWFGIPNTPNKKGLLSLIRDLDGERNQIIHWHTARYITDVGDEIILTPPNFWVKPKTGSEPQHVNLTDLGDFKNRAQFAAGSINMFIVCQREDPFLEPVRETWREIFQQPCVYPPSSSHPLFLKT